MVYGIGLYPDGRIAIGGSFTTYNASTRIRVARLTAAGSLDAGFNTGVGPDGTVFTVMVLTNNGGKVLIGGEFTTVSGYDRRGVAVLNGDPVLRLRSPVASTNGVLVLTADGPAGLSYVLDMSANLRNWSPAQTNLAVGPTVSFSVTNSLTTGWRFYRVRAMGL
ncbi:MAG: delta-60 repeat domain-containing protein [Verrucomicrobia bacterium]|nr:delta-60 repeat domain-containing protein [Verrucomicrobiota bacterium]